MKNRLTNGVVRILAVLLVCQVCVSTRASLPDGGGARTEAASAGGSNEPAWVFQTWLAGQETLETGMGATSPVNVMADDPERGRVVRFKANLDWIRVRGGSLLSGKSRCAMTAWVKLNSLPSARAMIVSRDNDYEWFLNGPNTLCFRINNAAYDSVEFKFTTNRWYHLAVTMSGSGKYYFVDGVMVGAAGSGNVIRDSGEATSIGGRAETDVGRAFGLDGCVDDLSMYDRGLAPEEIMSIRESTAKNCVLAPETSVAGPEAAELDASAICGEYEGMLFGSRCEAAFNSDGKWTVRRLADSAEDALTGTWETAGSKVVAQIQAPAVSLFFACGDDRGLTLVKLSDRVKRERAIVDSSILIPRQTQ